MLEVIQRSQLRMNGRMAAIRGSDGPRAPHRISIPLRVVVAAFSMGFTDRVDRGEVQYIETKVGNIIEASFAIFEGAVRFAAVHDGPRKHFIPGAEPSLGTIHYHDQLSVIGRGEPAIDAFLHDCCCILAQQQIQMRPGLSLSGD